ncbi:hypothetical protein OH799_11765 [Nocardia sp. NBC_00881]|uniref:hypothetical protein n=1 Tax=Nocardia sp. NBC_00881 TaxID=2975995 RepID=UPI00386D2624|nr:hypothetical protein OH799_11765 [Nocardia sp. NBC_00881]
MTSDSGASDLTLTIDMSARSLPGRDAAYQRLAALLASAIPNPARVELVLTDRFEHVAGEFATQSPTRSNPNMTAADYRAVKGDGAVAAARTIDLPDDKVVVVIPAGLLGANQRILRRTILHEAQHVTLFQKHNSAQAVHRRTDFEIPADQLTWEYMWIAESAIDEFRCERTMHARGMGAAHNTYSAGYGPIIAMFDTARQTYRGTFDLTDTYHRAFAALDRLAVFLAYGAASVAAERVAPDMWSAVTPMAELLGVLGDIPGTDTTVGDDELTGLSLGLALWLRQQFRANGFDYRYTSTGSDYFELLW